MFLLIRVFDIVSALRSDVIGIWLTYTKTTIDTTPLINESFLFIHLTGSRVKGLKGQKVKRLKGQWIQSGVKILDPLGPPGPSALPALPVPPVPLAPPDPPGPRIHRGKRFL